MFGRLSIGGVVDCKWALKETNLGNDESDYKEDLNEYKGLGVHPIKLIFKMNLLCCEAFNIHFVMLLFCSQCFLVHAFKFRRFFFKIVGYGFQSD